MLNPFAAVIVAAIFVGGLYLIYLADKYNRATRPSGQVLMVGQWIVLQNKKTRECLVVHADVTSPTPTTVSAWRQGDAQSKRTYERPKPLNALRVPSVGEALNGTYTFMKRSSETAINAAGGPVEKHHFDGLTIEVSPIKVEVFYDRETWAEITGEATRSSNWQAEVQPMLAN